MKVKRVVLTVMPIVIVCALFILKPFILNISNNMPECWFFQNTGLLCPGCGNTRSVRALLSFDLISAIKYNISVPMLLALTIVWYFEYVISAWLNPVRLLPRNKFFYITLFIIWGVYCIIRNAV